MQLNAGDVLISASIKKSSSTFFITQGSIALFVSANGLNENSGVAVGLAGVEGAVGLQIAMGLGNSNLNAIVQTNGFAYEVDSAVLALLITRRPKWKNIFSEYLWTVYQDIATLAAIAISQDVSRRLANWLILSAMKDKAEILRITQDHVAKMLGVRRASISKSAQNFKDKGLIVYSRGYLKILDLNGLRKIAHDA